MAKLYYREKPIMVQSSNPKAPYTQTIETGGKNMYLAIYPENPKLNTLQIGIGRNRKLIPVIDAVRGRSIAKTLIERENLRDELKSVRKKMFKAYDDMVKLQGKIDTLNTTTYISGGATPKDIAKLRKLSKKRSEKMFEYLSTKDKITSIKKRIPKFKDSSKFAGVRLIQ